MSAVKQSAPAVMQQRKSQLNQQDICELVENLITRAQAAGDITPLDPIVLVGGSALCLNGIRDSSGDIDLYGPHDLRRHAQMMETELRPLYGPHFAIDVTAEPTIWGRLRVPEINKSDEMCYLRVGGKDFSLRALDPETLFVIKSEAGREKDILDLTLIAPHTKPENVVARWAAIMKANPSHPRFDSGANLIAEISAQYLTEVQPEWIEALGLDLQDEQDLKEAFLRRSLLKSSMTHARKIR